MAASPLESLPRWALALVHDSRVARLGLIDDSDRPRVLPVTYAVCGDAIVSAVDHKPKQRGGRELARVRFLRRNPSAVLTVDHYDDDWSNLAWVQLLGDIDLLDAGPAAVLDTLAAKYAPYRERPPAGPFLWLRVGRSICWRAAG